MAAIRNGRPVIKPSTRLAAAVPIRIQISRHRPGYMRSVPGGETVAGAAYRLDQLVMTGRCQYFSQAADVYVHGTLFHIDVVTPYAVEQPFTRVHALGMGHEELQQAEFRGSQFQMLSARADAMRDRIEHQSADFHRRFGR